MPEATTGPSAPAVLTPVERINHLEKTILARQQIGDFSCGGTVPKDLVDTSRLLLYYKDGEGVHEMGFPASADATAKMIRGAATSPFGRGTETVYDPEYRRAKEYKPPSVALSTDILSSGAILAAIAHRLKIDRPLRATLSKVNLYAKGGFFKPHRDTALGDQHVGTITICLPTAFSGGALVITQDGHVVKHDWSNPSADAVEPLLKWAFLHADVQHEVLPVKSGTRATIAYDVFYADASASLSGKQVSLVHSPVYQALRDLFNDKEHSLPEGGRIAFGFRHAYPARDAASLRAQLKGIDRHLIDGLLGCGCAWRIHVVFNLDLAQYGEYIDEGYLVGKTPTVGNDAINVASVGRRRIHLISADLKSPDRIDSYDEDPACWMADHFKDVTMPKDIIWVTDVGAYGRSSSYVSYGNEATDETLYTRACVVVTIPPGDKRAVWNDK